MRIVLATGADSEVRKCLEGKYGARVADSNMPKERCLNEICAGMPDILITYRCRHIIPKSVYSIAGMAINIHPSLLPQYAGLNPWEAMERDRTEAGGVSIHRLGERADEGEIVMQKTFCMDWTKGREWNRECADRLAMQMIEELISQFV